MSEAAFALDARLQADTHFVTSLNLCNVLLMNDARFPWLILVPRVSNLVEIIDLPSDAQQQLWIEVNDVSAALRRCVPFDKLNIGALGNIVRQLHVHVIARKVGDAAWPAPVWGAAGTTPYPTSASAEFCALLRKQIEAAP